MAISRVSQSTVKQGLDKSQTFKAGIPPILGKFYHMGTVEVGAGGASSIEFTGIPAIYKHLQIRMIGKSNIGNNVEYGFSLQLGNTSAIDTGSNYAWHRLRADGSTVASIGVINTTAIPVGIQKAVTDSSAGWGSSVTDILDYSSSSKNKTLMNFSGREDNGSGYVQLISGLWINSSDAVSKISLYMTNANWAQYTTAALYGVK